MTKQHVRSTTACMLVALVVAGCAFDQASRNEKAVQSPEFRGYLAATNDYLYGPGKTSSTPSSTPRPIAASQVDQKPMTTTPGITTAVKDDDWKTGFLPKAVDSERALRGVDGPWEPGEKKRDAWRHMKSNGQGVRYDGMSEDQIWDLRCLLTGLVDDLAPLCKEWRRQVTTGECGSAEIRDGDVFSRMGYYSTNRREHVTGYSLVARLENPPTRTTTICRLTPTMFVGDVDKKGCFNPWRIDTAPPQKAEVCQKQLFVNVFEFSLLPESLRQDIVRIRDGERGYGGERFDALGNPVAVSGGLGPTLRTQYSQALSTTPVKIVAAFLDVLGDPRTSWDEAQMSRNLGTLEVTGRLELSVRPGEYETKALMVMPYDGYDFIYPKPGQKVIGFPRERSCDGNIYVVRRDH